MHIDFDLDTQGAIQNPLEFAVISRDRKVLDMVKDAIARHDTLLAYQPIVQANNSGHTAFYEGLMRLRDRTGRIIPASQFIDVAETTEIGRQIDCLALEDGLKALAQNEGLRLALNMSARSIGYAPWMDTLNKGLNYSATVAERLVLEITESSAMVMPDVVGAFMHGLHSKGISFALDDFGAGYTSFRYLRDLMFDIIKIDTQFIRDIHKNPDNQVLTNALVSIAQHFDMFTVAEGVEAKEDAEFLCSAGIDCMQGYLFGAPTIRPAWQAHDHMSGTKFA